MKYTLLFKYSTGLILILLSSYRGLAQDLMDELSKSMPKEKEYVTSTFKGTRLVNLNTVETTGKKTLEFRIAHRFGDFSSGAKGLWGLDGPATIQFHFDYGISDRLTIGLGRASYSGMYDGLIKYNIIRQQKDRGFPLSVTFLGSANVISGTYPTITNENLYRDFSNRMIYTVQGLLARKFSSKLSIQVTPIFIHYNLALHFGDKNDILAVGMSGRYKITNRAAVTAEYIYRINQYSANNYQDALSIGFDLETGGHVFQVFMTNALAINEVFVIPYTSSSWSKGQVRLGFNISRPFGGKRKSTSINK